jgi:hypothetical protein
MRIAIIGAGSVAPPGLALAERLRRKADWINPTRVRRPSGCLGRSAFTPHPDEVCWLL